jgi:hypothetical protein
VGSASPTEDADQNSGGYWKGATDCGHLIGVIGEPLPGHGAAVEQLAFAKSLVDKHFERDFRVTGEGAGDECLLSGAAHKIRSMRYILSNNSPPSGTATLSRGDPLKTMMANVDGTARREMHGDGSRRRGRSARVPRFAADVSASALYYATIGPYPQARHQVNGGQRSSWYLEVQPIATSRIQPMWVLRGAKPLE